MKVVLIHCRREKDMRTIVLGAIAALAMGVAGVSSVSAAPIKASPIDEAAGAVSLMTKAYHPMSRTTVGTHRHHRHRGTSPKQRGGKAQ
jgi:hypothetical protein